MKFNLKGKTLRYIWHPKIIIRMLLKTSNIGMSDNANLLPKCGVETEIEA
jgi:hypothetical protein